MALKIRGKLGTHSSDIFTVKGGDSLDDLEDIEGPPSEGDVVFVQSDRDPRARTFVRVLVTDIKSTGGEFGQFFYMELR
jgi:hypothetical protein